MASEDEKKVLDIFAKRHLVTRSELNEILKSNGSSFSIVNNLLTKRLIVVVTPLGESVYAITRRGMRSLND